MAVIGLQKIRTTPPLDQRKDAFQLTQDKAAKAMGITRISVAQYLNGHIALKTDIVLGFARLLGVSPQR